MFPTPLIGWDGQTFVRGHSLLLTQRWWVSPLKAGSGLMLKEGWTAAGLLRAFRSSHRTDHPCAQPPRHRAEPSQGVLRAPDEGEGALETGWQGAVNRGASTLSSFVTDVLHRTPVVTRA